MTPFEQFMLGMTMVFTGAGLVVSGIVQDDPWFRLGLIVAGVSMLVFTLWLAGKYVHIPPGSHIVVV